MITITAKTEGFRRVGIAFSRTPRHFDDKAFSATELKILKAEPALTVVENKDTPKGKGN